jgi:hypothetical protein
MLIPIVADHHAPDYSRNPKVIFVNNMLQNTRVPSPKKWKGVL